MKVWKIHFLVALSLVSGFVAVPAPALATCGPVSIVEDELRLTEGARGDLHIAPGGCGAAMYDVYTNKEPLPEFTVEVSGDKKTVHIKANADGLPEAERRLVVRVRQTGLNDPDDSATVIIPSELASAECVRGGEIIIARLCLTLSSPSLVDIPFVYDLYDGTAKGGQDYAPVTGGQAVIPAGAQTWYVDIEVFTDGLVEPEEYFYFQLRSLSGGKLAVEATPVFIDANDT